MSVKTIAMVLVSCDRPGCEADMTGDPPQGPVIAAARMQGWAISGTGTGDLALCPLHRRYQRSTGAREDEPR